MPIPSYLFAVASGNIRTKAIDSRCWVANGPEEVEGCKWELEWSEKELTHRRASTLSRTDNGIKASGNYMKGYLVFARRCLGGALAMHLR